MIFTVSTFNIRKNKDIGLQSFEARLPLIDSFFAEAAPDIVGFQEVMPEPYATLRERLPEYDFIGVGRLADGSEEAVPLAWNRDKFEKLDGGTFWISDTPEVPGSRAYDTYWPRICTWASLRVRDQVITVFNIHLDNLSVPAQELGLKLVSEKIQNIIRTSPTVSPPNDKSNDQAASGFCGTSAILLGDFNIEPNSEALVHFNHETAGLLTDHTGNLPQTYHGWQQESEKIDYIYTTGSLVPASEAYLYKKVSASGTCISDHWPVVVKLSIV